MLTDKEIEDLKSTHGEIFLVEPTDETEAELFIVCKRAQLNVFFDAFMEAARDDDANRMGAIKNFLRDVTVHPDRTELNARFEKYPGLPLGYFRGVSAEAKTQIKTRTKKL